MKTLLWGLTALLALLWTGLVALTHQVGGWLLGAVDGASLQGAANTVGTLKLPPMPPGLEPWLNTEWLAQLQTSAASVVQWLGHVMPTGDAVMGWVGPLLWVVWFLGLLPLLGVAALLHFWLRRSSTPTPPPVRGIQA